MATVQSLMAQLAQRVDPRTKDGTEITTSNVGSVAGTRFTAQRLLDIYNHARLALTQSLLMTKSKAEVTSMAGGIVKSGAITWASQQAAKPSDFIDFVSMCNASNVPMTLLPATHIDVVRQGSNPHYTCTASNLLIFDVGANFVFVGTASLVPDLSTYVLTYIGITEWVLANVTGGSTQETIDEMLHPALLEMAQAVALEMGSLELLALGAKLTGGK